MIGADGRRSGACAADERLAADDLRHAAGRPDADRRRARARGPGTRSGFTFRWLRCDATGGACVDIPGATAARTSVVGADVGSTIRVAVTARNAAGEATAVSAQTAVVT